MGPSYYTIFERCGSARMGNFLLYELVKVGGSFLRAVRERLLETPSPTPINFVLESALIQPIHKYILILLKIEEIKSQSWPKRLAPYPVLAEALGP